jgi:putative selenium metabolism hydrolase
VLLYDAHLDTVGVGSPAEWKSDPFTPVLKKGALYGRGASDNKAAIAAMVYGVKLIQDFRLEDDYTLYVTGVVQEEECDGLAVLHMIQNGDVAPDYVVLGECTDLGIHRGHRGRVEMKIVTKGISCHASDPARGSNAIYKMVPIIKGINTLNGKLLHHHFLGKGSVAVTSVSCETPSLNAIPNKCTIFLDRRLTMGESKATALKEIRSIEHFDDAEVEILVYNGTSYTGLTKESEKYFPTWVLPENHFLVETGVELAQSLFGSPPPVDKWNFSTDGTTTMGKLNIPTIGFGPGKEEHAHTVQDQVSVDQLLQAVQFYGFFPKFLVRRAQKSKKSDDSIEPGSPGRNQQISMDFSS